MLEGSCCIMLATERCWHFCVLFVCQTCRGREIHKFRPELLNQEKCYELLPPTGLFFPLNNTCKYFSELFKVYLVKAKQRRQRNLTALALAVGSALTFSLVGVTRVCWGGTGGYIAPQTVKKPRRQPLSSRLRGDRLHRPTFRAQDSL